VKNKAVTILALGGCFVVASVAQSDIGQVNGKVVSPAEQGIEGVSVKLISSVDDRIGRKTEPQLSDAAGNFHLPFDWKEVERATQKGATWQVWADKPDYAPARANLLLSPGKSPRELKIKMMPKQERGQLMSKVDSCATPLADARTVYVFDFASDMAPQKLNTFQELLGFKLKNGIRADLESARLLASRTLEIKLCREASVRDEPDILFVGKRLGCPGVISGYIEEQNNELKSVVRFTAIDPPLTDYAPDTVGRDVASLIQPNQRVNNAYLAFSSFILGTLYLKDRQFNLARQCFQHTKDIHPGSGMAHKADEILQSLQQTNPAKSLVPIGGPGP
jgi:hypothetical protein